MLRESTTTSSPLAVLDFTDKTSFVHVFSLLLSDILIVPTFDTKITEYLCSGRVFVYSDKF